MKTVRVIRGYKSCAISVPNPWGMGTDLVPAIVEWIEFPDLRHVVEATRFSDNKKYIYRARIDDKIAFNRQDDPDIHIVEKVEKIFAILDNAKIVKEGKKFVYYELDEDQYQQLMDLLRGERP